MAKLFGSINELVKLVFRKDNQAIGLEPNSSTTYTAGRDYELPPGDSNQILVSADSTQTLTNKTIDGDDNTVQDLPDTAIKTVLANADKFFTRDGSGVPTSSAKDVPVGAVVGTSDTQTLTNKTIDGDDNTVQDLPDTAIKTNITNANKFFTRDGSGVPTSAAKDVPSGDVIGTTDTQTLTNKTIDANNNTISNLAHGAEVDNPSSGVHGVTGSIVGTTDTQTLSSKTLASPIITTGISLDNQAYLELKEQTGNGSNYIRLSAPAALTGDTVFTLPDGDGSSNQVLSTNGSGTLSWSTVAAGIGTNFDVRTVATGDYVSNEFTITDSDGYRHILAETGATTRTIFLPAASLSVDRMITIKKVDSGVGNVIIDGEGAETIDGNATVTIRAQYESVTLVCNGTAWFVVVTGPASMSDSVATQLGRKIYSHGTTYNGGNAPTVTLGSGTTGTLSSVEVGDFIPYQMQDGSWRMRFVISVTLSGATRTYARVDVAGITAPSYVQAITGLNVQASALGGTWFRLTNRFEMYYASALATSHFYSGDVALASKPTWAY